MLSIPLELQLRILHLATDVPHLLEITPDPDDPELPDVNALENLVASFRESLKTRLALPLVSHELHALGTPILYECVHLNPSTPIPAALATFASSPSKASMVQHVILDVSPTHPEDALASLFASLPNVRILSVVAHLQRGWPQSPYFYGTLASAMGSALAPTLRRLVLHRNALTLFPSYGWDEFTKGFAHLEALVSFCWNFPGRDADRLWTIPLPDALPNLKYLHHDDAPLHLPKGVRPTHLHCFLTILYKFQRSDLMDLSLLVSEIPDEWGPPNLEFDEEDSFDPGVYPTLHTSSPSLVSLALSGVPCEVTRLLTDYTFPRTVTHLSLPEMWRGEENIGEEGDIFICEAEWTSEGAQAWVVALAGLPGSVKKVVVKEKEWVGLVKGWVESGEVDVRGLEECAFGVEDGEGKALFTRNEEITEDL